MSPSNVLESVSKTLKVADEASVNLMELLTGSEQEKTSEDVERTSGHPGRSLRCRQRQDAGPQVWRTCAATLG